MLLKIITPMKVSWHRSFVRELNEFPIETREDMLNLIRIFANGERLSSTNFKTFSIDAKLKVQEFRIKNSKGNWRAISTVVTKGHMVLLYAFHKKTQALTGQNKLTIKSRVKGFIYGI